MVLRQAREHMTENGGFEYNCFTFITHDRLNRKPSQDVLPVQGDSASTCARKLARLAASAANNSNPQSPRYPAHAVVLYSDRNNQNRGWDDTNVTKAVAVFMLTRGEHWYMGTPTCRGSRDHPHVPCPLSETTAKALLMDRPPIFRQESRSSL